MGAPGSPRAHLARNDSGGTPRSSRSNAEVIFVSMLELSCCCSDAAWHRRRRPRVCLGSMSTGRSVNLVTRPSSYDTSSTFNIKSRIVSAAAVYGRYRMSSLWPLLTGPSPRRRRQAQLGAMSPGTSVPACLGCLACKPRLSCTYIARGGSVSSTPSSAVHRHYTY